MKLHGVEMLPTSLATCFINHIEMRILEIANEGFTFRAPYKLDSIQSVSINFLVFKESRYEKVELREYQILEESQQPFYYVYTIGCSQESYQRWTSFIIRDYSEYVMLKLSGDDSYCSKEKVNYPAELDMEFYESYLAQKTDWFSKLDYKPTEDTGCIDELELAITLDNPREYEQYLKLDMKSYVREYFEKHGLSNHSLAQKDVQRIYVGNEFCHNLFPAKVQLMQILNKTRIDQVKVTLAFTYLRDEFIESMKALLEEVYGWCKQNQTIIEIVVNDWGMIHLLQGKEQYFSLSLGVLLNKRRKDPRYQYKSGYPEHVSELTGNSLNSAEYRNLLEQWNIKRYEYESCGYRMKIPTGHNNLHFPFYQTNTSQYCTLYAKCVTMDRANQKLVTNCPRYCEKFIFGYPKHLKMVGRYNSIFGMDDTMLSDLDELKYYAKHGIDRLVLNLI